MGEILHREAVAMWEYELKLARLERDRDKIERLEAMIEEIKRRDENTYR